MYVATEQFSPGSQYETSTDDALSVRSLNDVANALNNYFMYASRFKILGQPCIPHWPSELSETDEYVLAVSGPRYIPDGFTHFRWITGCYRSSDYEEGSTVTTFRLYCTKFLYQGPEIMDTSYLDPEYTVASFDADGDYLEHLINVSSLEIVRGKYDWSWLVLTAENLGSAVEYSIDTLDAWPYV